MRSDRSRRPTTISCGLAVIVTILPTYAKAEPPAGGIKRNPTEVLSVAGTQLSPTPAAPPTLQEAWWTGPIAASSAETLPRGHVLFEPYLFDVRSAGSDYAGSLTYILYGATDRLTIGAIPTLGSANTHANTRSRHVGVNDFTLTAQYRFNRATPGALLPTLAIVLQRTLPLGRFDRLDRDTDLGIGSGAQSTILGFYAQRVDPLGNGRPLRTRLNVTYSFAPSIRIEGISVYGTPSGFRGSARSGDVAVGDFSVEYSLSRRFVLATDLIYRAAGASKVVANNKVLPDRHLSRSRSFSIAPAIEYSWTPLRGALIGVRVTPKGENVAASVTPVIAFNAIF